MRNIHIAPTVGTNIKIYDIPTIASLVRPVASQTGTISSDTVCTSAEE